jgi:hypothetical protein
MELLILTLAELLCSTLFWLGLLILSVITLGVQMTFIVFESVLIPLLGNLANTLKSRRKTSITPDISESEKDTQAVASELPVSIPQTENVSKKKKTLWHKVAVWNIVICSVFLVLFFLSAMVANTFYFEPLLRFSLRNVKNRFNVSITFDKAEGSFWTGKIQLQNVSVLRKNCQTSDFDLKGNNVEIDLSMVNLLYWSFVFESVNVSGFKGTWEQIGKSDKLKPRKSFRIDRLSMEDIQIDFTDRTLEKEPFKIAIKLDNIESVPLRSDWAMFDVLFRSRGHGSVNDIPFKIDSGKGKYFWQMDNVPVNLFAYYIDALHWFDEGKIDLVIENKFDKNEVSMHWSLIFHDFHAAVPKDADMKVRFLALPLVAFFNLKSKHLPLEFELQIKENDFQFQTTTELNDFVRIILNDKMMDTFKKVKDYLNNNNE